MRLSMASSHCSVSTPRTIFNKSIIHLPTPSLHISETSNTHDDQTAPSMVVKRRSFTISMVALLFADPLQRLSKAAMADDDEVALELERYTDDKEKFTLLRPSTWAKVDKAGANVLFQDMMNKGSNNVGVVVSPVRISKLQEFGSPEFVAEKLIEAEKKKESTKSAEVVAAGERVGEGGVEVYEFEYKVDSTRGGMKTVFSAAFVASKKLYLLNISHSDGLENPMGSGTRMVLEKVLHSFGVSR